MYLHSRSSSTRGEQITLKLRCYFTNVLNNVSDWYFANSHNHSCCDDQDNDVKTKTKTQKPSQDPLEARQCLENIMSSSHCRPPLILTLRDSVTLYLELLTRKTAPGAGPMSTYVLSLMTLTVINLSCGQRVRRIHSLAATHRFDYAVTRKNIKIKITSSLYKLLSIIFQILPMPVC